MAFLTPDPRHLDRTDRPPARPTTRRSPARAPLPGVGRLAGRPGPERGRDRRRARRRPARARRPGRGAARPDGPRRSRPATRRAATCAACATSSTGSATAAASCSSEGQLADPLADVRQRLDEIVEQERAGVQRRLDETEPGFEPAAAGEAATASARRRPIPQLQRMLRGIAAKRLDSLDALPPDVGSRIRALQDYDFIDGDARQRFETLLDELRRSMLDRMSQGLADAVQVDAPGGPRAAARDGPGPQPAARAPRAGRRAVAGRGRRVPREARRVLPGRADARRRHRAAGRPDGGDAVAHALAVARAARRSSRTRSTRCSATTGSSGTSPSSPRTSTRCSPAGWGSGSGSTATSRWASRRRSSSSAGSRRSTSSRRSSTARAARATSARSTARDVHDLLGAGRRPGPRRARGPRRPPRAGRLPRARRRPAGAHPARQPADRPEGPRRAVRAAPPRRVRRRTGSRTPGHGGERDETSKPFEFGDPFHLDLRGTLGNALRREENAPGRRPAGTAVRLRPGRLRGLPHRAHDLGVDGAAHRHEPLDAAAQLLPRGEEGRDRARHAHPDRVPARQPRRSSASPTTPASSGRRRSPSCRWHTYEYGTNLQHGLLLARRILARQRSANKEIVVITDGEPTAHFEDGQVEFSYPPTRRTIRETLREVVRCTKDGITINTFMLERSPALTDFVGLRDRAQQGPGVLRRARAPGRVRAGRLRQAAHQAPVVGSPPGSGPTRPVHRAAAAEEAVRSDVPAPAVPPRARRDHRVRPDVRVPADRGPGAEGAAARPLRGGRHRRHRAQDHHPGRDRPGRHRRAADRRAGRGHDEPVVPVAHPGDRAVPDRDRVRRRRPGARGARRWSS